MNNNFTQITFLSTQNTNIEQFMDFCSEAGALSISIEDNDIDTIDEAPIYGEPGHEVSIGWKNSKIVVLLDSLTDSKDFLNELSNYTKLPEYQIEQIQDQDWVRLTQSQFEPIHIGQKLVIMPSWHFENHQIDNKVVINLDPGLAFGTGSHPTTALCLEWIEQNITNKTSSVLDYGCGSGILAIACKKFDANEVIGVDIDIQAVESAQFNTQNNQTQIQFFHTTDFDNNTQKFDVVIANILSNPLKILAKYLVSKTNNHLVLSGILARQTEELIEAYKPYIDLKVFKEHDGWVCMTGSIV